MRERERRERGKVGDNAKEGMQPVLSVWVWVWVCIQWARKLVEMRLLCILALTKLVHSAHGSWWRRGSSIHASLLLALLLALLLLHSQLYYCTARTEAGGDEAPQFMPAYMHAHAILTHYADVIRTAGTEAG